MTWNVWWRFGEWESREPAIVETLREVDADVVLLQEVWSSRGAGEEVDEQARRLAGAIGFHALTNDHVWFDELAFDNAILSRWPLERIADEVLPAADGRPGHRRVLLAHVHSPWGLWPVACTHLEYRFDGSATRRAQMHRVMEVIAEHRDDPERDLPTILGGDLNAVPDSDEIRMATGRTPGAPPGLVLTDAWEQAGDGAGVTWDRRNPHVADSAWPDRRIDQVMVSWPRPKPVGNPIRAALAGGTPVSVDGRPVWPSDHTAVVVDLVTPDDIE